MGGGNYNNFCLFVSFNRTPEDRRACLCCTPEHYLDCEGLQNYGYELIDTSIDLEQLDRIEDDPVEADLVVLPVPNEDRQMERKMREQMIAFERKRSLERRGSSGGVSIEEVDAQKSAQATVLQTIVEEENDKQGASSAAAATPATPGGKQTPPPSPYEVAKEGEAPTSPLTPADFQQSQDMCWDYPADADDDDSDQDFTTPKKRPAKPEPVAPKKRRTRKQ